MRTEKDTITLQDIVFFLNTQGNWEASVWECPTALVILKHAASSPPHPPPLYLDLCFYYPPSPFHDGFIPIFYSKHGPGYTQVVLFHRSKFRDRKED